MDNSVVSAKDILNQINKARTKPQDYAILVKKQIQSFIDEWKMPLKPNCHYQTNQGKGAWKEALAFLNNQKPLPKYELNQGLTWAADDHVVDLVTNRLFGHQSSNGDSITERIEFRCGQFYGKWGENVGSAFNIKGSNFAQQTILGLIIDDGVANRGHRKSIFSEQYKYIGSSSRISEDQKVVTVINFHSDNVKLVNKNKKELNHKGSNFMTKKQNVSLKPTFKNEDDKSKQLSKGSHSDKKVVASSTNTKTTTRNGRTTKIVTKKLKYSDGTEQEIVQQSTY